MQRSNHKRRHGAGFTLIEVLLVLVILVVIGSIAASTFMGAQEGANEDAARTQVGMFTSAIDMYRFHTKHYPEKLEELIDKPSDKTLAERWRGPYLNKSTMPVDPWDNEYKIAQPGKHNPDTYDVWSMGPDGDDQSDDDIGNWEK
ncbi:Type II secretion system protein G precursor [Posidoniimonas polymericola]|uniref:Type II secretion system core protein G n=1 Tax=Posidoniimonas polymericola TaxID=2528002 RepID=A0A5C5XUR4_9BACT|nr:type II secretion system major pseudopilin GspG [Posidoniimonas polymericola]TWT67007.1 Type II secretion system protein G precursor [Posidoniimonas polymericola]